MATNFVGFIHGTDGCHWTQAASGAAGRANVGLSPHLVLFWLYCPLLHAVTMEWLSRTGPRTLGPWAPQLRGLLKVNIHFCFFQHFSLEVENADS